MADVLFKKGTQEALLAKTTGFEKNAFYLTEDTHRLYIGVDNGVALLNSSVAFYNSYSELIAASKQFKPNNGDIAFIKLDQDQDVNALMMYVDSSWVQINAPQDLTSLTEAVNAAQADATKALGDAAEAKAAAATADEKAVEAKGVADSALSKANENAGSITSINGSITTINNNITELQGIVKTGANSNDKLREAISTNSTAASTAQTKANEAYTLAETADGKANTNAGNITNINNAIGDDNTADSIKGRIKANEGAIADINTAIGDDNTANSIKGRIKANENAIAEHGTAITSIQNNYATKTYAEQEADAAETAAKGYADTEIGKAKEALIGTGTEADDTIKGAKKYTDEKIAGVNTSIGTLSSQIGNLSNIMNFRGTFDSTDDVTDPINGDVIIVGGIEYVYVKESEEATGKWEAFGAATANEARFEAIEEAAEALTERVTALDEANTGKIAVIEGRLTATEGVANGAATGVNTLNGKVQTLEETTIPAINNKIGTVADGKNLAQMIADEETRAKGVEEGLQSAINTINNTTIPAINTAHNTLAGKVTTAEGEIDTLQSEMDTVEGKVSTLETKTGIASLGTDETLYGLITAEVSRAQGEEQRIEDAIDTAIDAALTWGSFN